MRCTYCIHALSAHGYYGCTYRKETSRTAYCTCAENLDNMEDP